MTSTSCASSVSGQKSSSQCGVVENRSKSCDTSCTSNSSCFFKRRKPMNPLAYAVRPIIYHKTNNPVKQRVMSAKLLKLRQLQSQLNDANYHLAELNRENQTLKTLQKRQDKALSKYENTNADLPRLIHSHEEEIRVLIEKNKNLRKAVRDLSDQLKQRDEELIKVREQLGHLERLNRQKHLTEREKLTEQMEDYKIQLQKTDEQVTTLNRKLLLESKTSKQRLNAEIAKHKQCQKELLHAFDEIDRLTGLLDAKENTVHPRNPKFTKFQGFSSLRNYPVNRHLTADKLISQNPVTDVKLEPLTNGARSKDNEVPHRRGENGFKAPMENIRQRLSSESVKPTKDLPTSGDSSGLGSYKSRPTSSIKLEKLTLDDENEKVKTKMKHHEITSENSEENCIVNTKANELHCGRSESSSEEDLGELFQQIKRDKQNKDRECTASNIYKRVDSSETNTSESTQSDKDVDKLVQNLDSVIQRSTENSKEEFERKLGDYCSDVLSSMKNGNKVIDLHKDSLKSSKEDTNILLETLQRTEKAEVKLKKSFFNMDDDMDFVKEILTEEHKFQIENKVHQSNNHGNETVSKKTMVNLESKKKLLATLRAIDNGDSVDSLDDPRQANIMKEIFGHSTQ